jgi:hypothetical protein
MTAAGGGQTGLETGEIWSGVVTIPRGTVSGWRHHRESDPSSEPASAVAFRTGSGPPTINVEQPEEG